MACEYSSAGSLSITTPTTAAPVSCSFWFRVPDITANRLLLTATNTTNAFEVLAAGAVGGDPLRVRRGSDATLMADTTGGFSALTWQHALVVSASTTDHRIYLNGASKGTGTTLQGFSVAGINFGFTSGAVQYAEIAAWNVALNDDEALALAAGYSPMAVRKNGVVFYMPLIREQKEKRGLTVTVNTSSPTVYDHPRILYPRKRLVMHAIPPVVVARSAINVLSLTQTGSLTEVLLGATNNLLLAQSSYPPAREVTAQSSLSLLQVERYNNNAESQLSLTQSAFLPEVVRSISQTLRLRQLVRGRVGNIASGRYRR
ncbi:MAG: hypothetical protein C0483_18720 [Pirellula sp.]|nr:hypothetical protein [Pirellula sp.]